jgi:hypothetical protein
MPARHRPLARCGSRPASRATLEYLVRAAKNAVGLIAVDSVNRLKVAAERVLGTITT